MYEQISVILIPANFKKENSYQHQAFFIKMLIATEKINLIFLRAIDL